MFRRVVHGDLLLRQIEELESEYGKLKNKLLIYGCGIVPIGKNFPDNLEDEDNWEITIRQLFGMKSAITREVKRGGTKDSGPSEFEIACPVFEPDELILVAESENSFSTAETIKSWDHFDKDNLTFYYSQDDLEQLTEQSYSSTSVSTGPDPLKRPIHSNELSLNELNEALLSQYKQNQFVVCSDDGNYPVTSGSSSSKKEGKCPSLGSARTQ